MDHRSGSVFFIVFDRNHKPDELIFFCMNIKNLVLYILGREQKYATFSSIDEFQGKKHQRNVHNNRYHI